MSEYEIIYCDDCGEPILKREDLMCLPMGYYHKECLKKWTADKWFTKFEEDALTYEGGEI
jgi:hypothetical protein